ncbi:unnamed protein product [Mucor fragilis]
MSLLPQEIVAITMDNIHSVSQLKQFRLVCKAWNHPALNSMLSQEIFLWSKQEIAGFCNFLVLHDPSKKYLVKRLYWAIGYAFPFTLDELQMAQEYCPSLQELSLDIGDKTEGVLKQSITDAWRQGSSVEKQHYLKKLRIHTRCPADYLEYLFYKYASIESLKMSIGVDKVFIEFHMQRVSYLISKGAKKDILFTYQKGTDGEKIISMLTVWNKEAALYQDDASEDCRIRVRYAF